MLVPRVHFRKTPGTPLTPVKNSLTPLGGATDWCMQFPLTGIPYTTQSPNPVKIIYAVNGSPPGNVSNNQIQKKLTNKNNKKTSSDRRLSITYSNYSISSNSSIHSNDNAHIVILASLVILVSPVSLVSLVILIILVSLVNSNNSSISSNSRVLDATQMLRFWLRSVSRVRVRLIRKRM